MEDMALIKFLCTDFCYGFLNSFYGFKTIYKLMTQHPKNHREPFKEILKANFSLNVTSNIFCVLGLKYLILPFLKVLFTQYLWLTLDPDTNTEIAEEWEPLFKGIFSFLFSYPIFLLVQIITSYRLQSIADSSFAILYGHQRPSQISSIPSQIADLLIDVIIQIILSCQYFAFRWFVPGVFGAIGQVLLNAMLTAFFCYSYKWSTRGWHIEQRIDYIECSWPYCLGFGFPMGLLYYLFYIYEVDISITGGFYAIYCPFLIVSANQKAAKAGIRAYKIPFFTPARLILNLFWPLRFRNTSL